MSSPNLGAAQKPLPSSPLTSFSLRERSIEVPPTEGISWKAQLIVFLIAFFLVVSRRPDALLNPQFFGEDGVFWFPGAYMSGWLASLLHPENGYFQTLPRLAAALALLVPLHLAPLVMNIIGITLQVLPVNLVLSARCRNWASLPARVTMAIVYIALPNTYEIDATITEGQWHLAVLASLVTLVCRPPKSIAGRAFDLGVVVLGGLSGPFSLVLLPLSAISWWFRRERWRLILTGVLAITTTIQLFAFLHTSAGARSQAALGATPQLFVRLLGGDVYLAALLGQSAALHTNFFVLAVMALAGTALLGFCVAKAPLEWKLFISFAVIVFAASLHNPMASVTEPQWEVLAGAPGIRYWFFPMLAFVWALVWCSTETRIAPVRTLAMAVLLAMSIGIIHDWRYPAYSDQHFQANARRFESSQPGTLSVIPIDPDGWVMRLTKKAPLCNTLPTGTIDKPAPAARVSGNVTVAGWVVASEPVQSIQIYVDHQLMGTTQPDQKRSDVDGFYPESPVKNKGWGAQIDMSNVAPGKHEIETRALEAGGCNAEFAVTPVERLP